MSTGATPAARNSRNAVDLVDFDSFCPDASRTNR
jgi:hypothetical protein